MPRAALDSLYLSDAEVARRVVGPARAREWDGIAAVLEREGFPKADPLLGGRYWPAVRAFLDRRHQVATTISPSSAADGQENWT